MKTYTRATVFMGTYESIEILFIIKFMMEETIQLSGEQMDYLIYRVLNLHIHTEKKWMPNSHCAYKNKNEGKKRVSKVKLLKHLVGNIGKYL